jgi:hypothetical protein
MSKLVSRKLAPRTTGLPQDRLPSTSLYVSLGLFHNEAEKAKRRKGELQSNCGGSTPGPLYETNFPHPANINARDEQPNGSR